MIFKYGLKQFKRHPVVNDFILLQFSVIIILICAVVVKLGSYFVVSNTFEDVCQKDTYQIVHDLSYDFDLGELWFELSSEYNEKLEPYEQQLEEGLISQEEFDEINKQLNEEEDAKAEELNLRATSKPPDISSLPYVEKSYILYSSSLYDNDDNWLRFLNEDYAKGLDIKMESGKWLFDAEHSDEYVNIVVFGNNDYSVGDIIDLNYSHLNSEKKSEDLPSNVKGKIVGIMDYLCYEGYYDNSQGLPDEYLTMSTILPMFKPCTLLAEYPTNKDHLVFSNKDIEIREDIQMVKLDEDISDENRKDFFLELTSKKYQAFETKEQYQHTYQREKKELQNNIVLIGISSLTAIICLVGITTLSVSKEIKTYSIYCLCGMTRKQCIGINAVYTFFLILIPSIIALIVRFLYSLFKWYQATSLFQEYYTDRLTDRYVSFSHYFSFKTSEIIAIGILFIVSLISAMIIPYFTLKKLQLTESLKNKN